MDQRFCGKTNQSSHFRNSTLQLIKCISTDLPKLLQYLSRTVISTFKVGACRCGNFKGCGGWDLSGFGGGCGGGCGRCSGAFPLFSSYIQMIYPMKHYYQPHPFYLYNNFTNFLMMTLLNVEMQIIDSACIAKPASSIIQLIMTLLNAEMHIINSVCIAKPTLCVLQLMMILLNFLIP